MLTFNLLPPEKQEARNFQKKLTSVLTYAKIFVGLIAILSLFMVFLLVYLSSQKNILENKAQLKERDQKILTIIQIEKEGQDFDREVRAFIDSIPQMKWSSFLIAFGSLRPEGLTVQKISYTEETKSVKQQQQEQTGENQKTETIKKIIVAGRALARENLIAFQERIKASPLFSHIVSPLLNFEKMKDIAFTISAQIK